VHAYASAYVDVHEQNRLICYVNVGVRVRVHVHEQTRLICYANVDVRVRVHEQIRYSVTSTFKIADVARRAVREACGPAAPCPPAHQLRPAHPSPGGTAPQGAEWQSIVIRGAPVRLP
jgi:hypothetical protein